MPNGTGTTSRALGHEDAAVRHPAVAVAAVRAVKQRGGNIAPVPVLFGQSGDNRDGSDFSRFFYALPRKPPAEAGGVTRGVHHRRV
jgi:hypothetical protein